MLSDQTLVSDIKAIIVQSKENAVRAVDHQRTLMYWDIGKRIFEQEQQGKDRADYGKYLTQYLAKALEPEFGSGFSRRQIELFRQFYRVFPIANALRSQLSWTQYRLLMRLDLDEQREFYTAETIKNNWTSRQLERQVFSNLYERLLLSNDKESVLAVARREKMPSDAKEITKDPMILEFLGLKREKKRGFFKKMKAHFRSQTGKHYKKKQKSLIRKHQDYFATALDIESSFDESCS
ncbi:MULTISPECIES: DUF1016 N-terminal domain-containing protein [Sphingobacterium]|uniref:DUF1016 N-terminal domain-containing protein n=1 Tax=Sphingobacterium TaxID=28453 RepID=UPI002580DF6A|nr:MULTISPECIES: DUF1016 N-terminal domain-containing protein [Sphingobacterium]